MSYIMIFLIAIVTLIIVLSIILDTVLFFWRAMPKKLPRKYDHIFNSKEYVFNYKDDRIEFIDRNQAMFMKRPDYIRINDSLYVDERVTLAFIEFDLYRKYFRQNNVLTREKT